MTEAEIRTLDGPQLDRLAFELGLSPEGTTGELFAEDGWYFWQEDGERWEPHEDIAQTDVLFRNLRTRGWTTSHGWYGLMGYGFISVGDKDFQYGQYYGRLQDESENMAMLRCVVLAVALWGGRQL